MDRGELYRGQISLALTVSHGVMDFLYTMINFPSQTIRTVHRLMAKEESWLMPSCLGMALVETCTLMLRKTGALISRVLKFDISHMSTKNPHCQYDVISRNGVTFWGIY